MQDNSNKANIFGGIYTLICITISFSIYIVRDLATQCSVHTNINVIMLDWCYACSAIEISQIHFKQCLFMHFWEFTWVFSIFLPVARVRKNTQFIMILHSSRLWMFLLNIIIVYVWTDGKSKTRNTTSYRE